ncbi:MAG TPA: NAD(P)-binding domain-containing protein [Gaiellaceae bacterium]|nr:NAD(P)-binding domain-containing protein [Gaiellaceae bacterium]
MAVGGRPFPPGDYDAVVVGSGPGGLQASYFLRRLGVRHALLSADEGPGGMFRRFPLFERLISWTHPSAEVPRESREYEAHDQNSLLADEPELRALVPAHLAEGARRPAREEMAAALAAFAERAGLEARYGCRWEATRREEDGRLALATADGEYRCRAAVFAVGMTEPWVPPIPGLELAHHYVHVDRGAARYRDRRVVIVGKRNSAFEVGEALVRAGVRELTLVSPRPPDLGRLARSPLRPWYLTAYDEHVRGAPGRYVLDASVERVERTGEGHRVHVLDPARGPFALEADEVIAATGFRAPLGDLPALGLATVLDGRLPALTPFFESVTLSGAFFAGNVTQAAQGLRKQGTASLSGMVCGFRYNARVLARHLAETRFGVTLERPALRPDDVVAYLLSELNGAPELALQKGYLARVLTVSASVLRDEGILPLQAFVDGGQDGVAATLEFDEQEEIRPALYVRAGGVLREALLPPHPLRRYEAAAYRAELDDLLRPLL